MIAVTEPKDISGLLISDLLIQERMLPLPPGLFPKNSLLNHGFSLSDKIPIFTSIVDSDKKPKEEILSFKKWTVYQKGRRKC